MLDFLLSISRALPELIPVFGRGERIISKDWVGGWDYRFKQNVLCHVTVSCILLYCNVIPVFVSCCTHRTVYHFVSVCVKEPVKCTAAPFVKRNLKKKKKKKKVGWLGWFRLKFLFENCQFLHQVFSWLVGLVGLLAF